MLIDIPQPLVDKVKAAIKQAVENIPGPHYAAFDADGTLWDTDMGENFFLYQIENKLLKALPADPWAHYHQLKKEISPKVAYLWLAQINQQKSIAQVREWSAACVKNLAPMPTFNGQKQLIDYMHLLGVQVYVVTASIKWSVEPAAEIYGIPQERVLGVTTKINNGIVTDIQEGPITWREGKVEGILAATGGVKPLFASGNTTGDLALLESAQHVRLAMAASDPQSELFQDELKLVKIAKEKGWFYHLP